MTTFLTRSQQLVILGLAILALGRSIAALVSSHRASRLLVPESNRLVPLAELRGPGRMKDGGYRMKIFLLALLLGLAANGSAQTSASASGICGPDVKHSTKWASGKSPLESNPPADKAVLYVIAPTYEGGYLQMKLSAEREWIGVNQYKSYFVVALEPGAHDLCSKSGDNATHLKLTMEAGKSYFIRQDTVAKMGVGKPPTSLGELTAEDAAVFLKKCKRMEFHEKERAR